MIEQGFRAFFRAFLMASLIATPGLLLPRANAEMVQMIALLGLIAGALVLIEYRSSYPSFVKFRHAAP